MSEEDTGTGLGDVRVEHLATVSVVALSGEHDLSNAGELEHHLDAILVSGRHAVVDLCQTAFIDSSILRVLVNATTVADRADKLVVLASAPDTEPRRLVDLALADAMPTFDSRDAAVAHVSAAEPRG
jgi:anti-anti-sigma factor